MQRFKSHKVVEAAKIEVIEYPGAGAAGAILYFSDFHQSHVSHAYMVKHKPEVGGYYVKYADGYESFSPAKAFEEGYTAVDVPEEPAQLGCTRSHPHENMDAACERKTVEAKAAYEAAVLQEDRSAPSGKLNPNHPTTQMAAENWYKIIATLLNKFGENNVLITGEDLVWLADGTKAVVIHDGPEGLRIRITTEAEAQALAREHGGLPQ